MPQNLIEKNNPQWVSATAPSLGDYLRSADISGDFSHLAERDAWLRLLIKNVCDQQGVVLSDTETTGLLSALDARYFKNSQLDNQATDAEVAAAIVAHLAAADPHAQYALKSISLIRFPSGTTVPTAYAGDVIYIGADKYEWIGGAYVRIKPIVAKSQITAINTTASCSVSLSIPKNGIFYITGTRNVSAIGPDAQHYSRILLNGVTVALDTTLATVTHSLAIYITAGNHTIELVGQHSLGFSLWLSVLYVPN